MIYNYVNKKGLHDIYKEWYLKIWVWRNSFFLCKWLYKPKYTYKILSSANNIGQIRNKKVFPMLNKEYI